MNALNSASNPEQIASPPSAQPAEATSDLDLVVPSIGIGSEGVRPTPLPDGLDASAAPNPDKSKPESDASAMIAPSMSGKDAPFF